MPRGNAALSMIFHGVGVSPVHGGGGGNGVVCPLKYTAGSVWASEAGGSAPRMEEKRLCHLSGPPPPLSPCRAVPYSRRSTLEKIDCLFLPDCSRVTGCKAGGGGGLRAGGCLLIRMDFSASLLVGRAGTGYGRLLKE